LGLKNYVHIQSSALQALAAIPLPPSPAANTYSAGWQALADKAAKLTDTFLATAPYSDLKVFETLLRSLPAGCNVQYGNSTPVRYSGLFKHNHTITVNANRGTSGIDGCVSTAAGAAYANGRITVCIVGDISFLYDSNALWNNYLSTDLRIVVINNSGGNIFRLIEGPGQVPGFEKYFETRHSLDVKHLALMYGLPYYFCDRLNQLDEVLTSFYQPANGKHCILEIKTDGPVSADTYKAYFDFLRTHNS
jgi:2-succinyl-5-enolpyruvyl-6-hydroxy-3-cyclohexene-1-carboxylate synthase